MIIYLPIQVSDLTRRSKTIGDKRSNLYSSVSLGISSWITTKNFMIPLLHDNAIWNKWIVMKFHACVGWLAVTTHPMIRDTYIS